jgi:hypothetical protein
MTFPTVDVTVNLALITGEPCAGVTVRAKLDKNDSYSGGIVIAEEISATTDDDGVAVLTLFPNHPTTGVGTTGSTYKFTAAIAGAKSFKATAQIPNSDCNLQDVMDLDTVPSLSAAQQAEANAQSYAAQAGAVLTDASFVAVAAATGAITTVAGIAADVTTVSGIHANVTTVAGDHTPINTVAGDHAALIIVASDHAALNTVAGIAANVSTVAGISAAVSAVAADAANINAVAGDLTNINTVSTNVANVNTAATNMDAIIAAPQAASDAAAQAALLPKCASATRDPTTTDDINSGYDVDSLWYRSDLKRIYICIDATASAAVWVALGRGHPGYRTGRYYSTFPGGLSSTAAPTLNTAYFYSFSLQERIQIKKMSIKPSSAGTTSSWKVGIWKNSGGVPTGTPVLGSDTSATTTATTLSEIDVTDTYLDPGEYFIGQVHGGTGSPVAPQVVGISNLDMQQEFMVGRSAISANTPCNGLSVAKTFSDNFSTYDVSAASFSDVVSAQIAIVRILL